MKCKLKCAFFTWTLMHFDQTAHKHLNLAGLSLENMPEVI